ncbi:MAG: hypothetical protein MK135_08800 [Polyangiaceae bacterium]|nr:hypothetical protein [Polyangiaceae bacterium]
MSFAAKLDKMNAPVLSPAQRIHEVFELFEHGVALKRLSLKRQFPDASDEDLSDKLRLWLAQESEG